MTQSIPFWEKKLNFFQAQIKRHAEASKQLSSKTNQFGTVRVLFFIIAIVAIVYFINERNGALSAIMVIGAPLIFGWLVKKHNSFKKLLKLANNKQGILADEIKRIKLDLNGIDGGVEFTDHLHPYTTDMDVFGKHSLFSLINRSQLHFGRQTLASWFQAHAEMGIINSRQKAVEELKADFDWQLNWWAENRMHPEAKELEVDTIFKWFEKSDAPIKWLKPVAVLGLIQLWLVVILSVLGLVPATFIGLSFLINILLLAPVQRAMIENQKLTQNLSVVLNQHLGLFKMLLSKELKTPLLTSLKNELESPNAAEKISLLNTTLTWMHSRNGMMYWILVPFALTDYWVLSSSIKWKANYGTHIRKWFTAIGDMEALLSMAGYSFAHPTYKNPEISNTVLHLSGEEIGHPLIKHEERVNNNFNMSGQGALTLITGANMSGKSTFERSLGTNIILAQMGASCCAGLFGLSQIKLFTSMRTQDDLSENTSSFYAELKRLKQLVDLTKSEKDKPIFYLLDEILKGTNSEDRNKGAESLMRQLMKTNSMGLISTHDLSLASLDRELPNFTNYSFNSEVKEDEILFDYKLHNGPCHTFNAVPLMKRMGIEIV